MRAKTKKLTTFTDMLPDLEEGDYGLRSCCKTLSLLFSSFAFTRSYLLMMRFPPGKMRDVVNRIKDELEILSIVMVLLASFSIEQFIDPPQEGTRAEKTTFAALLAATAIFNILGVLIGILLFKSINGLFEDGDIRRFVKHNILLLALPGWCLILGVASFLIAMITSANINYEGEVIAIGGTLVLISVIIVICTWVWLGIFPIARIETSHEPNEIMDSTRGTIIDHPSITNNDFDDDSSSSSE
eukprot:CAMPEP_0174256260 /NCGR_PEP_ID=MMETSP0439-20130205/5517_1 /TAXON_ID=0 /ORGANISM="Stereomyxa ramosa, Strain Chinc5" /LENGTH=242 /DNA_ID=CAMNT_0015338787 /DNA_START=33 /DNA_END=761 /DNA_ORIENTATION=-